MEPRKAFLLVFNFISVLLFSGIIFGWTALKEILVNERFYSYLCEEAPCDAQSVALAHAFTYASAASSICALPGGWLLDAAGPVVTILVGGTLNVLGLLGVALCEKIWQTYRFDVIPFLMVAIAVAGSLIRFCGYACAFLFPGRSSLLLALASVLFDGSCMVFPVLKLFYDAGISFSGLFWAYTLISLVVFILLPIAWKLNSAEMAEVRAAVAQRTASTTAVGLQAKPITAQLRSFEFFVIMLFSAVELTHSNLYLATVDFINTNIAAATAAPEGSAELVNSITGFVVPLGFFAVPCITASIRRMGNEGALQVTNILGILLRSMQLIPSLYLQVGSVTVFAAYRAFLFSNVPAFNAHYFGVRNMGRIQGVCFLVGGLLNFVQAPLVHWSVIDLRGDFTPFLLLCLAAIVVVAIPVGVMQLRQLPGRCVVSGSPPPRRPASSNAALVAGPRVGEVTSQQARLLEPGPNAGRGGADAPAAVVEEDGLGSAATSLVQVSPSRGVGTEETGGDASTAT